MSTKNPFDPAAMSDNVKEQAQQIWLAGLGAFAKAQEDGTKAFEKLVSDGITMQRKVSTTAEEKLAEVLQQQRDPDGRDEDIQGRRPAQRPVGEPLDGLAERAADEHRAGEHDEGRVDRRFDGGAP
jgi:poly(hydroxyalkanoate) granule-associated protein